MFFFFVFFFCFCFFFLCTRNQKVINRHALYVKHMLITYLFLDYSIDKNDIAPS